MRLILKILLAPILLALWLFTGVCTLVLKVITILSAAAAVLLAIMGIITIVTDSVTKGCIGFLVAFLLSPWGVPMIVAWGLGQVYILRLRLMDLWYLGYI